MKKIFWLIILTITALPFLNLSSALSSQKKEPTNLSFFNNYKNDNSYKKSPANEWLDIALEATSREVKRKGANPTVLSRTLAIVAMSMYNAWAMYDDKAIGTQMGGFYRQPVEERTYENKKMAIAYATYWALLDVYPDEAEWLSQKMEEYGYNPTITSLSPGLPESAVDVGLMAAFTVIKDRHNDGSNQLGSEPGSNGLPYSSTINYIPINTPSTVNDPNRWQPIPFKRENGEIFVPEFLSPHWKKVKPFALKTSDQFLPPPPPRVGDEQMLKDVDEVLAYNSTLTPYQKAIVEFFRDGPHSTGQAGHWLHFAQLVSLRDHYNLDQDVKLFFAVAMAGMDAFIASWDTKIYYDTSRPWTLIRHYYKGKKILGWAGPGQGVQLINAEDWMPYSPANFITPPFPGYVSGHSTASAACAKVLELFTCSDYFGEKEFRKAGILTEPKYSCEEMQQGVPTSSSSDSLNCQVTIELPTFTATAEMAGLSRIMGGYHIQSDNLAGLEMGRKVGLTVWEKVQRLFNGQQY